MTLILDLIFVFCLASLSTFIIAIIINATQRRRAKSKSVSEAGRKTERAPQDYVSQEVR